MRASTIPERLVAVETRTEDQERTVSDLKSRLRRVELLLWTLVATSAPNAITLLKYIL